MARTKQTVRTSAQRAAVAKAAPAFTPQDEKKLKAGISKYGRQWATIKTKLLSKHALTAIKVKGLEIIKASPESKTRAAKAKRVLAKCATLNVDRLLNNFSEQRVRDYLRFLVLKAIEADYDCELVSPTSEEDEVWHYHLLDTRNYREVCADLCGKGNFIDHDPDGGMDVEARDERREYAMELREELNFKAGEPKLKKPAPAPASASVVGQLNLKVVTPDGNEILFKCKETTPLQKLMTAFCNRQGVEGQSVRFMYDGCRLNPSQTPQVLDMDDWDVIDVQVENVGC